MATLIKIKYSNQADHLPSVMRSVIAYCLQPEKTRSAEEAWSVSGLDCDPEIAYQEFMANKAIWDKTDGLCFRHYVQSFHPDEDVNPEEVIEMGLEFARRAWPGYSVVVAFHFDSDHMHNHFVIDTVHPDTGKKLHEDRNNIKHLRDINDEICLAHGLSVLSPFSKGKTKSVGAREYRSGSKGESWKFRLRAAIKYAMQRSGNREEFIAVMKKLGYGVRWEENRKHITYTCYREPRYENGAFRKCRDNKLSDEKFLKENMEYEFEIRQEILAGRDDRDARDRSDRRNTHGEDQRRGMGEPCEDGRGYAGSYTIYDDGEKEHVHYESFVFDENGNPIEESGGAYERANRESDEDHHGRERKTGWESERESYFSGRKMGETPKHTVVDSNSVRGRSVGSRLALGGLVGLASLTDDDNENKTAEEIEAEERARLAGQNVAAVLELVKLGVELATQHSDSADEPVEEPTLKM